MARIDEIRKLSDAGTTNPTTYSDIVFLLAMLDEAVEDILKFIKGPVSWVDVVDPREFKSDEDIKVIIYETLETRAEVKE